MNKINLLYERTAENWDEMLIVCDVKANKSSTEFFNLYNPVRWNNVVDFSNMLTYYNYKLEML